MTLIGKIFTVLILLMSLVFMTIAMTVYATHKNWRDVVKGDSSGNQGLEKTISELNAQATALQKEIGDLKMKLQQERAARASALQTLLTRTRLQDDQLTTLSKENERLVKSEDMMKTNLELTLNNEKALKQEVDQLRSDIKIAQADRDKIFNEVVLKTDELQQRKVEQERLAERAQSLTAQTARMKRVLTAFGKTEFTPVDGIAPPLDGYITAVNNANLVEINLGSDDGIHIGNQLEVFRGQTYLGRIIIKETAPDHAVGEIVRENRRGQILKGDHVSTKLG
ncbi:hypothetical protein GC197_13190 [bacterium]|nr:hypothetical protein [bacterium]